MSKLSNEQLLLVAILEPSKKGEVNRELERRRLGKGKQDRARLQT